MPRRPKRLFSSDVPPGRWVNWPIATVLATRWLKLQIGLCQHESWPQCRIYIDFYRRPRRSTMTAGGRGLMRRFTMAPAAAGELAAALWRAARVAQGETIIPELDKAMAELRELQDVVDEAPLSDSDTHETVEERVVRLKGAITRLPISLDAIQKP